MIGSNSLQIYRPAGTTSNGLSLLKPGSHGSNGSMQSLSTSAAMSSFGGHSALYSYVSDSAVEQNARLKDTVKIHGRS